MANIDQEDVDGRLGRANHILRWCYILHCTVTELCSAPAVTRLVTRLIPVEHLGNFVAQVAHTATPTITAINELHERVDIGPATTTSRYYSIGDKRYWRFVLGHCTVGSDDQGQRNFGFGEQRRGIWERVQGASLIRWVGVGELGRRNSSIGREPYFWGRKGKFSRIWRRCEEIGGLERKRLWSAQTHLTKLISESIRIRLAI